MTRQELIEKIEYRKQKLKWCLENGRDDQAKWNQDQIESLEKYLVLKDVDDFNDINID